MDASCLVKVNAGAFAPTTNGIDVAPGDVVTIKLGSVDGVSQWAITCLSTDETSSASAINASLAVNGVTKTATFTVPTGVGRAFRFESKVVSSLGSVARATFGIYVPASVGLSVGAMNETTERDGVWGWLTRVNGLVRTLSAKITTKAKVDDAGFLETATATAGNVDVTLATVTNESVLAIDYVVTMCRQGAATKVGRYKGSATFARTGNGNAGIVGTAAYGTDQETVSGDGVAFVIVNPATIVARLTSADADARNWTIAFRVQETRS